MATRKPGKTDSNPAEVVPERGTAAKKARKAKNPTIQVVDNTIQVSTIDRNIKTLADWKTALLSAEAITQPTRKRLYDLYASVELDDQVVSCVAKRRRAISRASIQFQEDGTPIDAINELIDTLMFRKLATLILDARLYGYSLIQVDLMTKTVELVPRAHVVPSRTQVVNTPYATDGIDYTQSPYDRFYLPVGETNDLGLLYPVGYCVLIKRPTITDWATFNELYAQPLRVAEYDPADPVGKAQLSQGMKEMGAAAYALVPIGSKLQLVESNKTGAKDTYDGMAERMDKAISKMLIGQTMTLDAEGGQYKGDVHERVADEIVQDDLKYVVSYLNERLKPIMLAQGFPVEVGKFVVVEEEARIPKDKRLDMDLKIHEVVPLDLDYLAREYNVPIDKKALAQRQAQAEAAAKAAAQPPATPTAASERGAAPANKPQPPAAKKQPAKVQQASGSPFNLHEYLTTREGRRELFRFCKDFFAQAPTR